MIMQTGVSLTISIVAKNDVTPFELSRMANQNGKKVANVAHLAMAIRSAGITYPFFQNQGTTHNNRQLSIDLR